MGTLDDYIKKFQSLGCATVKGQRAPHKPILLLAVIDEISNGALENSLVRLSQPLIERFKKLWDIYVPKQSVFRPAIEMPFFHLHTEGFWNLIKTTDYVNRDNYSFKQLKRCFYGVQLPSDLIKLINDSTSREALKDSLLQKHFNISSKKKA